jgi:hypothetical protein
MHRHLVALALLTLCLPACFDGDGRGEGADDSNLRPTDAPDFVLVSVSGHNLGGSGNCEWTDTEGRQINCEYLGARGTPAAMMEPALVGGADVEVIAFSDSFYSWEMAATGELIHL